MTRLLALDVDGVLLDPDRGGDGHWTNELQRRHDITRDQLREHFFTRHWDDVVNGRQPLEGALDAALDEIGSRCSAADVIDCWHAADFVVIDDAVDLARRAVGAGVPVVLATNQSHERAAHLHAALGERFPIADVWYSAEFGVQKHDARFFELARGRVHPATDIVFVDDTPVNVERAAESGWHAIHADGSTSWTDTVAALLDL